MTKKYILLLLWLITFILNIGNIYAFDLIKIKKINTKLWDMEIHNNQKYEKIKSDIDKIIDKKYKNLIRKKTYLSFDFKNKNLILLIWKDINNSILWNDYYYLNVTSNKYLWLLIKNYWLKLLLWKNDQEILNLLKNIELNWKKNQYEYCSNDRFLLYKPLWDIFSIQNKYFYIRYNKKITDNLIKCYIYENMNKFIFKKELVTRYHPYRKANINLWLNTLKWFYKYWDEINAFDHLKTKWNQYKEWYALFWTWKNNSWVYAKKVKAWWLCWVSTIVYQWLSKLKWFDVKKVYSHQSWWDTYYWTIKWIDSTVFFSDNLKYAYKNLIIKNNFWDIYLDYFSYIKKWRLFTNEYWKKIRWTWFIYWVKIYSLNKPFNILTVKDIKKFNKWNLKCYEVWFFNKNWTLNHTRTSCYKTVNQKIVVKK